MLRVITSVILSGFLFTSMSVAAYEPTRNPNNVTRSNWWTEYLKNTRYQSTESRSTATQARWSRSYLQNRKRTNTTVRKIYSTNNPYSSRNYRRNAFRSLSSTPVSARSNNYTRVSADTSYQGATVTIHSPKLTNALSQNIDEPIDVFEIGIRNDFGSRNTVPEVLLVRNMEFEIIDREGAFLDFSDFKLRINGEVFRFNTSGGLHVTQSQGNRVTRGDSLNFDVDLLIEDVGTLPNMYGGLRVKLTGLDVIREQGFNSVQSRYVGSTTSQFLSLQPYSRNSGNSVLSGQPVNIYGKTLAAGSSELVLALGLESVDDDLQIRDLTVRESLSNGAIDGWASSLQMIDNTTGSVLDTAYFSGGKASFSLNPPFTIYRNQRKSIAFRLNLRDNISINTSSNAFKLDLAPQDIDVYSLSTGNALSLANKTINTDSEIFAISAGGAVSIVNSGSQPSLAITSNPNPVYRFTVNNPSSDYISLARITADLYLGGGLVFPGGISPDDFAISDYANGTDYIIGSTITPVSSSRIRFDFGSEYLISPGSSKTFSIHSALEDNGGGTPAATAQIPSDSTLYRGTLNSVRSTGVNFIWSDHSASPHTSGSNDWNSGYKIQGLPTSAYVNR